MKSRTAARIITLAGLAVLSTAACSSTTSNPLGASAMCTTAGGTYSDGTCAAGPNVQTAAEQACDARGGVYFSGGDYCEVDSGLTWKP